MENGIQIRFPRPDHLLMNLKMTCTSLSIVDRFLDKESILFKLSPIADSVKIRKGNIVTWVASRNGDKKARTTKQKTWKWNQVLTLAILFHLDHWNTSITSTGSSVKREGLPFIMANVSSNRKPNASLDKQEKGHPRSPPLILRQGLRKAVQPCN